MPRRRRRNPVVTSPPATRPLTVVVIAHVDTGPLWYQWIARAGHEAWLWYAADAPAGPERLVQETSPDILLVHVTSADDPGWMQVQEVRRRFPHARLPVVAVGDGLTPIADPDVLVVRQPRTAEELLEVLEIAENQRRR